jgi:hypothetical protein
VIEETKLAGMRIHDGQGAKQALGVLMELSDPAPIMLRQKPLQRLRLALELVDRPRLLAALVHRQHDAAV